jgi:S1-C subfamily serine protease
MDDILLLEAIERYLDGNMSTEEKNYFEDLRKKTPEIDQMVVEHSMFLHQMDAFAGNRNFKHQLHQIHTKLASQGDLHEGGELSTKGRVIQMWNKYKKITAIAASTGGVIALVISGLVAYFSPAVNPSQLQQLKWEINQVKRTQQSQDKKIDQVAKSKAPENAIIKSGGSSFLIDESGFLVTNAHVVKNASTVLVVNNQGQEFKATVSLMDEQRDLAILKINDADFKFSGRIPYSFKKTNVDLGDQIFTLGYPRNEIVYNEGYLSAKTGFEGDTISCQIAVTANPGNSGGPVVNKNGEVIGILSTKQARAEGVVFAVKSKFIVQLFEDLKKSEKDFASLKLPSRSAIRGLERTQQIKKVEDCVFMVKVY